MTTNKFQNNISCFLTFITGLDHPVSLAIYSNEQNFVSTTPIENDSHESPCFLLPS